MRLPLLFLFAVLVACSNAPDVPVGVTSRAATATYACIAPRLERLALRHRTRATPDGWHMDLQVFAGPPAGWYSKGWIEHTGRIVLYAPDGATAGIGGGKAKEIGPIVRRCSR